MKPGTRVEVIEPDVWAYGRYGTVMDYLPGIGVKVFIDNPKLDHLPDEVKLKTASWGNEEWVRPIPS